MIKVHENLYVGNLNDCYSNSKEIVIVHACKSPCHQIAVGYRGNLNANHPNYLILEKERDLFLNMVDMEAPLLPLYTDPIIKAMFKKKEKLAYFSLKGLTDELEQGGYFKIIEDLTGIAQHTLEFEVEERILIG